MTKEFASLIEHPITETSDLVHDVPGTRFACWFGLVWLAAAALPVLVGVCGLR